ncbi:hypothetical protein [Rhizobium sullae]|uniref:hypothetical protein n=1 Tax=Rhizobium sullae TaxID=50338 RepID=UPI00117B6323|nr:hypothetical protein [Rhizobium sullae]
MPKFGGSKIIWALSSTSYRIDIFTMVKPLGYDVTHDVKDELVAIAAELRKSLPQRRTFLGR